MPAVMSTIESNHKSDIFSDARIVLNKRYSFVAVVLFSSFPTAALIWLELTEKGKD